MTQSSGTLLRLGSRGSPLALAQVNLVREMLCRANGPEPEQVAIEVIRTSGDRIQDRPLAEVGGKGLFTKEIEEALADGRIDLAVHSAKGMPSFLPDGRHVLYLAWADQPDKRAAFAAALDSGDAGASRPTEDAGAVTRVALSEMAQMNP